MTKNQEKLIYQQAIDIKGKKCQLGMMQEEATELAEASLKLALATRKIIRNGDSEELLLNLASEMADVEILSNQMKMLFPELKSLVQSEKIYKLHRLRNHLNEIS